MFAFHFQNLFEGRHYKKILVFVSFSLFSKSSMCPLLQFGVQVLVHQSFPGNFWLTPTWCSWSQGNGWFNQEWESGSHSPSSVSPFGFKHIYLLHMRNNHKLFRIFPMVQPRKGLFQRNLKYLYIFLKNVM